MKVFLSDVGDVTELVILRVIAPSLRTAHIKGIKNIRRCTGMMTVEGLNPAQGHGNIQIAFLLSMMKVA